MSYYFHIGLEVFFSVAMATRILYGAEIVEQLRKRTTQGSFLCSLEKFYPVVMDMSFDAIVEGHTPDRRQHTDIQ